MKRLALSEVKDDLSRILHLAEDEEIVITRHGRPAGVLLGFRSEDDWFDYRIENDPRFLNRIESARVSLRAGRGTRIEDLDLRLPNQRMDLTTASGTPPARLRPRRSSGQTGFTPPGRAGRRRAGPR